MTLWVEGEIDMDEASNKHPFNVSGNPSLYLMILSILSDRNQLHSLFILIFLID